VSGVPATMSDSDYSVFELGDVVLLSGEVLPDAWLAYKTWGSLNDRRDNAIIIPTYYTGTHRDNAGYIGTGRAIDPARYFIVSPDLFGNGLSSSPSNTPPPYDGPRFPRVRLYDSVACQHRLVTEVFGIERVALVTGWSMGGSQSYQWAAQFPDMVERILPFCASAKTSPHNFVFLDGVRAALQADCAWADGDYTAPPEVGLRAFGRVYAGWAYSHAFYRDGLYRELGFDSVEALLDFWEEDQLPWDANDLMAKLWAWQQGDISANPIYDGDIDRALGAIRAKAIVMPCRTDLYFPPEDNAREVELMPNAELRIIDSDWGHCVASPGKNAAFAAFYDQAVSDLFRDA
jgi:homoserine O-acetyltransferase